ncbi:MAG: hypothetical protein R3C28_09370 [Pirellulaceae bacterium]
MSEAAEGPKIDFRQTKITREWKYESPLIGCRFHPSGTMVFAAAQDQTVQRWNLTDDSHASFVGHESWLRAIGFSLDGNQLYTAGYDGQLIQWDAVASEPKPIKSIVAHDGWVRWLDVSFDGKWLATGGNDNLVKVWSADSLEQVHQFTGHEANVYSTFFHPQQPYLLSGDLSGIIRQWDLATGEEIRQLKAEDLHTYNGGQGAHYGGVRSMSLSPNGKHLACSGLHKATNPFGAVQEPLIVILDWETGEKVRSLEANEIDRGIAWRSIYHADGFLIGCSGGGTGGFLLFYEGDDTKETHKFKMPNTVLDLDLNSNGYEIATVHYDRHIRISSMAVN